MNYTFRWRDLIRAVADAWPVWLTLGGLAFAVLVGWKLSVNVSAGIRYAGTLLQVLGLATVAIGLSEVRRSFDRPSLVQKILAWLRQIMAVFLPPKPVTLEGADVGVVIASGDVSLEVGASPGASLDLRVAILEENLNRLRDEVHAKDNKLRRELGSIRDALEHEQRTREAESHRIATKLEDLAVGGLHLELVGLIWLVLGVLGTSIPDEIAKLLEVHLFVAP